MSLSWIARVCALAVALAMLGTGSAQAFSITSLSLTPTGTQAGSHPDVAINLDLSGDDDLRNLAVHLPPGLLGNPNAAPTCTEAQFKSASCPAASAGRHDVRGGGRRRAPAPPRHLDGRGLQHGVAGR